MNKTIARTFVEFDEERQDKRGHLNFLGYPPCALKHTIMEGLEKTLIMQRSESGNILKSYIPTGCDTGDQDQYDGIWKVRDIDDFPDVVASMGFGDFFRRDFVERFVSKGFFRSVWDGPLNEPFEKGGFRDPNGWYTIYAVMPFVMLVDKKKLGNTPIPKRWNDLMDRQYQGQIIFPGAEDHVVDVPLHYFYKEHGFNGLAMLAANVKSVWHPAQMARTAGTLNPAGAAIYILPWFFAGSSPKTDAISIVWPEDGALTSPLYLLAKKSTMKEMATIVDYIAGEELGRNITDSFFPSLNPHIDNKLPEGAFFKWLGWDYIKSNDPAEMSDSIHAFFLQAWKEEAEKSGRVTGMFG